MTKQSSSVGSGFDVNKIWKGRPTPIKREAKEMIIKFLEEKNSQGDYSQKIIQDLGVTFEYAYRLTKKTKATIPTYREALMSTEAQEWAGLSRRDPCIDYPIINGGVLAGSLHTWSTIINHTITSSRRMLTIKLIKAMPEI